MQENEQPNDYRFFLTSLYSLCSLIVMPRLKDIVAGLGKQSARIHQELVTASDERSRLLEAAQRFRELEETIRTREESLSITYSLLLTGIPQKIGADGDAFASAVDEMPDESAEGIKIDFADISDYPLWKIMRELVRQTSEIRVYELESHLKSFGVKTTRSAIESALVTHRKEFKVYKRGREKYVALKGA